MTSLHTAIICFGIFNLCLLVFCRQLAPLILKFFTFGRGVSSPEKVKKQATRFGYEGAFSDPSTYNPTQKQAIRVLAWSGVINFLGCIGLYYLINTESVDDTEEQQTIETSPTKRNELPKM